MPTTTGKKKLTGKAPARDAPLGAEASEPLSTEDSIRAPPLDPTPEDESQTLPQFSADTDLRAQINQRVSNTLGATVQLTDDQFRVLLEQLAATDPNFTIPTTENPTNFQQLYRTGGGGLDDSPSNSSSHRSYQGCRSKPRKQHKTPP
jgi:hypothetical protein